MQGSEKKGGKMKMDDFDDWNYGEERREEFMALRTPFSYSHGHARDDGPLKIVTRKD